MDGIHWRMGCEVRITRATEPVTSLARFRPEELSVAIDAGPVAIDKFHRIAADRTVRRRTFIYERQFRQFKIVIVSHKIIHSSIGLLRSPADIGNSLQTIRAASF